MSIGVAIFILVNAWGTLREVLNLFLVKTPAGIDIHELEGQRFLSLPKGNAMRDLLDEYCHNAGFEPNIFIECDSAETVRKTLRLGGVISLVPEISWERISTDTTVLRPLSKPEGKRYLYLAERNRAYLSDSARIFRKYMLEFFKNLESTYSKKLAGSPYGKTTGNKTAF
jgi:DNA-binding transcriptional LysR family regulator